MKQGLASRLSVSLICITLLGCMTLRVSGPGASGSGDELSDSTVETFHGSYWPFSWSDSNLVKSAEGCAGLHTVDFHTNAGYALVSLLTIGLYVPQTVELECWETPPPVTEETKEADPGGEGARREPDDGDF